MDQADLVAQQDTLRTQRAFVSFLTTAFGSDQQTVGMDGMAVNAPYQYQSIGPTGVGVEGAPRSSAQGTFGGAAGVPPLLLVAAGALLVYLLVK